MFYHVRMLHFVATRVVFFIGWVVMLAAVMLPISVLIALAAHDSFWRDPSRGWFMNFFWVWDDFYNPLLFVFIVTVSLIASLLGLFPGYHGPKPRSSAQSVPDADATPRPRPTWREVLLLRRPRSGLGWLARVGIVAGGAFLVYVNCSGGGWGGGWTGAAIGNGIFGGFIAVLWLGAYHELRRPLIKPAS